MVVGELPGDSFAQPPTGEYRVTPRVVSDDCQPPYRPPAPWSAAVQAGAEAGHAKVNVPLVAIPPSNATSPIGRSDVMIEPKKSVKTTWVPMPQCSSYELTRTLDIVESSANGFKVALTVEHGDSMRCSSTPPMKCTTKIEQSYELVKAACPAECTRGVVFRARGEGGAPMDVDCRCP